MEIVIANMERPSKPFLDRIHLVLEKDAAIAGDSGLDAIVSLISKDLDFSNVYLQRLSAAARVDLDEFILEHVYRPKTGDVYALPGFELPYRNILLGIMPRYKADFERQDYHLSGVCRKLMELSRSMFLRRVTFPFLGPAFGFPKPRSARLMLAGISDRMTIEFDAVNIVCPDQEIYDLFAVRLEMMGLPQQT